MNELTNYLPMLLALVLALTLVTNIIVQVLKSLLYDMLPTNLMAYQPAGLPGGRGSDGGGGLRPVVLLPLCHHRLDDRGADRPHLPGSLLRNVRL